ncbi:MAG: riboflavin kinase, partial [Christensenellales bacterium]
KEEKYASVTNVGTKPTFNDDNFTVETHVLNFNSEVYGESVKISFLKYLREIKKFSDENELKNQIKCDAEIALKIFNGGKA